MIYTYIYCPFCYKHLQAMAGKSDTLHWKALKFSFGSQNQAGQ